MNNYLKQLLKTCGLESAIDCPYRVFTFIVPISDDTKVEVASRINRLLNIYPRYMESGHLTERPSILLLTEGCSEVFAQKQWPISVQIPDHLVRGERQFRFSLAIRPPMDQSLLSFTEDVPDAERLRISWRAHSGQSMTMVYGLPTVATPLYSLECIPKAGVNPEVLATKLRLMYS